MSVNLPLIALALLASAASPAGALLSNIHEMMTAAEIFETFGATRDSIPDYQVYPITLPGSRRKRAAIEKIQLKVELNGTEIDLNFRPIAGHLASKYTPVWLATTDEKAYKNIRYDPLTTAMTDIGEFRMYHDVKNDAAIVVYDDPDEGSIIEGIVTSNYAIKSLPKRLMGEVLKLGNHLLKTPVFKRSIVDSNEDQVTSFYALFENTPMLKSAKRSVAIDEMANYRRERETIERAIPHVVYPEILLILDHNAIRSRTITQALRFMLAFWNAADMVYNTLTEPQVRLNIAGIIIAGDDTATPYIAEDASQDIVENSVKILKQIGSYFYDERVRFPPRHYDMIIGMTKVPLCDGSAEPCEIALGYAATKSACSWTGLRNQTYHNLGNGVIYYNWRFGGVRTAVHEAAHLFGVKHDGYTGRNRCDMKKGYVMAPGADYSDNSLKWSPCSLAYFHAYFSSNQSSCLDNEPLWIKPVKKILPGRWLTLDGQCRNVGFERGCEISGNSICSEKGCAAENSEECVGLSPALPGTECGHKMFCNSQSECVKE